MDNGICGDAVRLAWWQARATASASLVASGVPAPGGRRGSRGHAPFAPFTGQGRIGPRWQARAGVTAGRKRRACSRAVTRRRAAPR